MKEELCESISKSSHSFIVGHKFSIHSHARSGTLSSSVLLLVIGYRTLPTTATWYQPPPEPSHPQPSTSSYTQQRSCMQASNSNRLAWYTNDLRVVYLEQAWGVGRVSRRSSRCLPNLTPTLGTPNWARCGRYPRALHNNRAPPTPLRRFHWPRYRSSSRQQRTSGSDHGTSQAPRSLH